MYTPSATGEAVAVPSDPRSADLTAALLATRERHSATEALLDAISTRYGINRNDLRCLEILEREGPMSPRQLAVLSHLSQPAITKIVDRLAAAGYLSRRPSAEDRRAQVISTSTRHAELRAALWRPIVEDANTVLGTLSDDVLRQLTHVLRRLADTNRSHARRLPAPHHADQV